MKFHKTIRFKLTLWYSLLMIILNCVIFTTANFFITDHYQKGPGRHLKQNVPIEITEEVAEEILNSDGTIDIEEFIKITREDDLGEVRRILVIIFSIFTALSFGGGYIIAGRMLEPIKTINKTVNKINSHNLNTSINHEDIGDEISELIMNINNMIARLNKSFALQKQFVENASHELKTPLAIIKTNLDAINIDKTISDENFQQYMNNALKSTQLMNKLIEDLLLLSLADKDVKMQTISVRNIITETVNQLNILAQKNNVKLALNINISNSETIRGNSALLQRAFMNIIENAINYSKEKGEIIINVEQEKGSTIIEVIDNGIGIPKDQIEKVYTRFYRVDRARSKDAGGTGLGLSITKKIIDLHLGKIFITSEKNLGTQVKIVL